jgi:predicted oxidoreductase
MNMEKIYLSDAGPKVSPAVYGFYRWEETQATEREISRIVDLCLSLGINTFDHADIYGGYQCEQVFGKVLASKSVRREDIVLFTKCGINVPHPSRPEYRERHFDSSAEHIMESVERSLRNLNTDYIDIFLLQALDPLSNLDETAAALRRLRESGKVRNIGLVNFSVFQHQLLSSYLRLPIVSNHVTLNLLDTSAFDNGQLDYMKQRYIRPLAMMPLAEGRIHAENPDLPMDLRLTLLRLAGEYGVDVETIAVAWLVRLGALPLIGTTDEESIRRIVKSFDITLDRQDWYALHTASHR